MPAASAQVWRSSLHHDEDAQVYINGILAAQVSGYNASYETVDISAEVQLRSGPDGIH